MGLLRPIAEYIAAALSLHTRKLQRRTARFVRTGSGTSRTRDLGWSSMQSRRTVNDLTLFYKIYSGAVTIPSPSPSELIEHSLIQALLFTFISIFFSTNCSILEFSSSYSRKYKLPYVLSSTPKSVLCITVIKLYNRTHQHHSTILLLFSTLQTRQLFQLTNTNVALLKFI